MPARTGQSSTAPLASSTGTKGDHAASSRSGSCFFSRYCIRKKAWSWCQGKLALAESRSLHRQLKREATTAGRPVRAWTSPQSASLRKRWCWKATLPLTWLTQLHGARSGHATYACAMRDSKGKPSQALVISLEAAAAARWRSTAASSFRAAAATDDGGSSCRQTAKPCVQSSRRTRSTSSAGPSIVW